MRRIFSIAAGLLFVLTATARDFSVLTLLTPEGRPAGCGFFIPFEDGERLFTVRHLLAPADAAPPVARTVNAAIAITPDRLDRRADRMLFRGQRPADCRLFLPTPPPPDGTPVRIVSAAGSKPGIWRHDGTVLLTGGNRLEPGESGAPVILADGRVIGAVVGRIGPAAAVVPIGPADWETVRPDILAAELRKLGGLKRLLRAFDRLLAPGMPRLQVQFLRLALPPAPEPMYHTALETDRQQLCQAILRRAARLNDPPFGIRVYWDCSSGNFSGRISPRPAPSLHRSGNARPPTRPPHPPAVPD